MEILSLEVIEVGDIRPSGQWIKTRLRAIEDPALHPRAERRAALGGATFAGAPAIIERIVRERKSWTGTGTGKGDQGLGIQDG